MLEPITRIEHFLSAVSGSGECPSPITRVEYFLGASAGVCECPEPITRLEMFLAAAAGNGEAPEPITRLEFFLGAVSGKCEAPEPITRIEYFLKDWAEGGGSYITKVIEGNAPLTFTAVAAALVSLTQYGKTEQNGTPTPSAPVDIVCNNGTLKMRHRSGLPSGYKLLEYVGGSGSQYVITDVYLASTDVIECEYRNSSTTGYGAVYGVFKLGESSALYGNQTYYGYDQGNNKVDTEIRINTDWHSSRHDFVNGTLTIDDTTVTFTPFEFANTEKNAVLSRYYNNSYGYNWKGYIRKFKVTRGNEVICDLLPAKNSNDVAGLYDLISGNFYTATGGTLLEGNVVDDYELIVDGTPEVLSLGEQTATVQNLYAVGDYKDEQDIISGAITREVGVKVFDGTEAFTLSGTAFRTLALSDKAVNTKVICSHFNGDVEPTMAVSTMPDLSVKGYGPNEAVFFKYSAITTVADFKSWLADQYAAGTPVIVLYPLAEETTETVTGQSLRTEEGSNTVSAVAEVTVPLKVEYKDEG